MLLKMEMKLFTFITIIAQATCVYEENSTMVDVILSGYISKSIDKECFERDYIYYEGKVYYDKSTGSEMETMIVLKMSCFEIINNNAINAKTVCYWKNICYYHKTDIDFGGHYSEVSGNYCLDRLVHRVKGETLCVNLMIPFFTENTLLSSKPQMIMARFDNSTSCDSNYCYFKNEAISYSNLTGHIIRNIEIPKPIKVVSWNELSIKFILSITLFTGFHIYLKKTKKKMLVKRCEKCNKLKSIHQNYTDSCISHVQYIRIHNFKSNVNKAIIMILIYALMTIVIAEAHVCDDNCAALNNRLSSKNSPKLIDNNIKRKMTCKWNTMLIETLCVNYNGSKVLFQTEAFFALLDDCQQLLSGSYCVGFDQTNKKCSDIGEELKFSGYSYNATVKNEIDSNELENNDTFKVAAIMSNNLPKLLQCKNRKAAANWPRKSRIMIENRWVTRTDNFSGKCMNTSVKHDLRCTISDIKGNFIAHRDTGTGEYIYFEDVDLEINKKKERNELQDGFNCNFTINRSVTMFKSILNFCEGYYKFLINKEEYLFSCDTRTYNLIHKSSYKLCDTTYEPVINKTFVCLCPGPLTMTNITKDLEFIVDINFNDFKILYIIIKVVIFLISIMFFYYFDVQIYQLSE